MALTETDKAWIRQEIQNTYKRHGWGKFTGFIKDWSGTSAAFGVLIFLATQWGGYIEFRTETKLKLQTIEKSIEHLNSKLSPLQIGAHSTLPSDAFQSTLPDLKSALKTAKQEKLSVAPKVLNELQTKLLDAQKAPDFWPTVAEFVSYRSQMLNGWQESTLPACTDKPPIGRGVSTIKGSREVTHGPLVYSYCKIVLDSVGATLSLSPHLSFADVVFEHCAIFYSGGPIVLFPVKIARDSPAKLIGAISFNDCLFSFSFPAVPSPDGQKLAKALLAATSNSVQVQFEQQPS